MSTSPKTDRSPVDSAIDKVREAQDLLKQDRGRGLAALNEIFRGGTVPDPPLDGRYAGELIALDLAPGLTQLAELITARWMPWQGKRLDAGRAEGDNIFSRGSLPLARLIWPFYRQFVDEGSETFRAFLFNSYVAPGRADTDLELFKIDYARPDNPGLTIRRILDEVVQLADGYYLGKVNMKWWWGRWQLVGYFSLRGEQK